MTPLPSWVVLQISDVPSGPSPITALVSLLVVLVVLATVGYVVVKGWRRVAGHVRYDRRNEEYRRVDRRSPEG